ncbi:MAG: hypothetical protein K2Q14_00235 [Gammaproteobacteria bacterium]|nr:hypothetical protein [Gammaproteobacteria bacterium]
MKVLPLFYYPSHWLWIDDDQLLLNCMMEVFGEKNAVTAFPSAQECIKSMKTYQAPLSCKNFLMSNIQDLSYGFLKHTPIDFDVTLLADLADDPARYQEITVMVIDYDMPEMDGFALAQALQHLPIQKILLTGKAEQSDAIAGFNTNLIHRFIQKGAFDAKELIPRYLRELSIDYFRHISAPLLSYLETEAKLPLSDPVFIDFFENYCEANNIKEYYLIDKQGSFLCIDDKQQRSCLVIQSDQGLDSWLTIYKDEEYLPDEELALIQNRKKIPFFGIGKEGWQVDTSQWLNHLHSPDTLDGRSRYYWARVELGLT